jgi:hypothetical protein
MFPASAVQFSSIYRRPPAFQPGRDGKTEVTKKFREHGKTGVEGHVADPLFLRMLDKRPPSKTQLSSAQLNVSADPSDSPSQWTADWLDSVANGSNTMSQRKLSSIERRGGGIEAVRVIAERKGVHLLLLEDDKGNELVAASIKPFKVVC